MKILVLGLRGFPAVQGGVETHAEHLYPELVKLGFDVTVVVRSGYQALKENNWKGVKFKKLWAPRYQSLEAIVHSLLAILYAGIARPDVVHIHAVGPALVTPIARLLGLRVVVTHHGPDYDREKWNGLARWILKLGEKLGMSFAHERIAISPVIAELVGREYCKESHIVPNGVAIPKIHNTKQILEQFGLQPGKYVLLVSRFVPEKRHLDLLNAFERAGMDGWKLVLVGAADHSSSYDSKVLTRANDMRNVVCTGFLTGLDLAEIYSHAGLFVLPSSHEGLPIALLEALSCGLPCLASDIPANLSVGLKSGCYFRLGAIDELAAKLDVAAHTLWSAQDRHNLRTWVAHRYNWPKIAVQTSRIYQHASRGAPESDSAAGRVQVL